MHLLCWLPPLVVDPTLCIEKGLLAPRGDVDMDILQGLTYGYYVYTGDCTGFRGVTLRSIKEL